MRKLLFQSIFLGGLSALGIMVGNQKPALAADDVKIEIVKNAAGKFVFSKPEVPIKKNDSITWVIIDPPGENIKHHLVSDTGAPWTTGDFKAPTQKTQTFTVIGEVKYHCIFHGTMQGTITVE